MFLAFIDYKNNEGNVENIFLKKRPNGSMFRSLASPCSPPNTVTSVITAPDEPR